MKQLPLLAASCGVLLLLGAGCTSTQKESVSVNQQIPADSLVATSSADAYDAASTTAAIAASSTAPSASSTGAVASSTSSYSSSSPAVIDSSPLAFPGVLPASETQKKVRIKTTLGDIVIQLMPDQGPRAASNFAYLVKHNFYNGTIFHRVIPGFMIQGGDPTGTGMGGPGYQFDNDEVKLDYTDGVVAMANAGRNTNGSQFFIMVANTPLPPDYSIFGKVVSGLDVAHSIAAVSRNRSDRPDTEVKMLSVTLE